MAVPIPDLTPSRALRSDVEAYVIDLIRTGDLRPDDRVNEAEIARRLQISRSPVREAFTRLIKDDVLDHAPRRGVFVAQPSVESMEEIAGLRAVIEGFAARQAAAHLQPEEVERLRRVVEEGAAAGRRGDWLAMEEKNAEFHDLLVGSARHRELIEALASGDPSRAEQAAVAHVTRAARYRLTRDRQGIPPATNGAVR